MTKAVVTTPAEDQKIQKLQIWDNQGETYDRYTVVWPDGTYLKMSERPFHPQGLRAYGENAVYFHDQQPLKSHYGKAVTFREISNECQKCILEDLRAEEEKNDDKIQS